MRNTVVFIDGDFWHCNPKVYNESFYHPVLKKTAKEVWQKDEQVTKELEKLNYTVIRIWESELKKNNTDIIAKYFTGGILQLNGMV